MTPDDKDAVLDLARANLTPDELPADMEGRTPAPEGEAWRTVPVEPTEAMIEAAHALWGEGTGVNYVQLEPEDFYAAMLAASPVVPVGVSREGIADLVLDACREYADTARAYVGERKEVHTAYIVNEKTDAILAALRPTDTGWRDIATAPRDGTRLVLWDLSRAVFGSWRVDEGFSSKEPMWLDESYDDYSCGFASNPLEPTYWMPIPPAPTDTGRE